jgi:hypothetical protein
MLDLGKNLLQNFDVEKKPLAHSGLGPVSGAAAGLVAAFAKRSFENKCRIQSFRPRRQVRPGYDRILIAAVHKIKDNESAYWQRE